MLSRYTVYFLFAFLLSPTILQAQLNISLQGQLTYDEEMSDIWGYTDALGNEYALVGTTDGVSIVDISIPTDPDELHYINGTFTFWRDLKTYGDYAYIINEAGNGGGLLIIDLSDVANNITTYTTDLDVGYTDSHNIFIDENGIAYLFGATTSGPDNVGAGTLMIDVAANPTNPTYLGIYNTNYVHDGFVRGDTLWAAEINAGQLAVVDVSNKTTPSVLATKTTPKAFAHAVWVSDDNNTAFLTEEKSGAWIISYDVSDLADITELDRFQSFPGTNVIPHNTFVDGNFIINSYYTSGIVVLDATHPDNLIQVGHYDTSTSYSGMGFNGCWGVYPYFSSGNIIASDIETGLYVLNTTYLQACYLEGTVTDANTTDPIFNVQVEILTEDDTSVTSDFFGEYKTGIPSTGTYTVRFTAAGYVTQNIEIDFTSNGQLIDLDITMEHPCSPPSNLTSNEVTYQTATVSWGIESDAQSYSIRYRMAGTTDWQIQEIEESTAIQLTNLEGCTNYECQIASQCDTGLSDYSSSQFFETLSPSALWLTTSILKCGEAIDLNTLVVGDIGGTWSGGTYLNPNGIFTPNNLDEGFYPATYTVGEGLCSDNHTTQISVETCKFNIRLKVLLEGAYTSNGEMHTKLWASSLLPFLQPFNRSPWNYNGTEEIIGLPPSNMTDWILVELRNATNLDIEAQAAGLLLTNGNIVDMDGVSDLEIEGTLPDENYFVVIRARNHLAVMSNTSITLPSSAIYDFTSSNTQVSGNGQMNETADGEFVLITGDINSDGLITVTDFNFFNNEYSLFNAYLDSDLNQDRAVTVKDFNLYQKNASKMAIPLVRY